jgi:hypothetical protein
VSFSAIRAFLRDETGAGTVWALAWFILLFGFGGLAVDITSAFRTQTQLQATADAGALSGAIDMPVNLNTTNDNSVVAAVNTAYKNMHLGVHGTVLMPTEVVVGDWDHANKQMVPQAGQFPTAVLSTTRRADENENPLSLTFLRILSVVNEGFDHWNVHAQAVAERFIPECLTKSGMIARGRIDYQSNNVYSGDFCIHSQDHVKVSNLNQYGEYVTVSMPDRGDLTHGNNKLSDGYEASFSTNTYPTSNMTLDERVISNKLDPKMVDHIDTLIATFLNPALDDDDLTSQIIPNYLRTNLSGQPTTATVLTVAKADFNKKSAPLTNGWQYAVASDAVPGPRVIIHVNNCTGNDKITIGDNTATAANPLILKEIAIISDCQIDFTSNVHLIDVVIASRYKDGPAGNVNIKFDGGDVVGRHDDCTPGGGVLLLSTQSISSPAKLELNGVQAVAAGNISFAAQGTGLFGIHFQAGGTISVTSNEDLGGACSETAPPLITAKYFRLVY